MGSFIAFWLLLGMVLAALSAQPGGLQSFDGRLAFWVSGALILLGMLLWSRQRRVLQWTMALMLLWLGLVAWCWRFYTPKQPGTPPLTAWEGQPGVTLFGQLISPGKETSEGYRGVLFRCQWLRDTGPWQRVAGQVRIGWWPKYNVLRMPEAGTTLQLRGMLTEPGRASVWGGYDAWRHLRSVGAVAGFRVFYRQPQALTLVSVRPTSWPDALLLAATRMRAALNQHFTGALGPQLGGLLGGFVLGEHATSLDAATHQAFASAGLLHLLAASGMNVAIVAALAQRLLCFLPMSWRWLRLVLVLSAIGFYCLMTGFPPSVQRAAAMLTLALVLKQCGLRCSNLTLLWVAVALWCFWQPEALLSVGFQFSVLATWALLALAPPVQAYLGFYLTRALAGALAVPLTIQAVLLPLSTLYFNTVPVYAVPLNLLALPIVGWVSGVGFVAAISFFVWSPLSVAMATLAVWPLVWLDASARWAAQQPDALWHVASPPPWALLAWTLAFTGWALWLAARRRLWLAMPLRRALLWFVTCLNVALLLPWTLDKWQQRHRVLWIPPRAWAEKTLDPILHVQGSDTAPLTWAIAPRGAATKHGARFSTEEAARHSGWKVPVSVDP
jgi:ComEC/Rec2-related protein